MNGTTANMMLLWAPPISHQGLTARFVKMTMRDVLDIKFHNFMGLRFVYQELINPEVDRTGTPTIYLGGAFQSIQNVQNYAKLSHKYSHTIMVDILGFGDSDILPSSYKMELLADSIDHFICEKGFDKVNMIGTSYGAVVAYMLASKSPEKMNRIILGGFMDTFDERTYEAWAKALWFAKNGLRKEFSESMTALLINLERKSDIRIQNYLASMMVKKLQGATYAELDKFIYSIERLMANRKTFPAPQCETLMLTGELDSFTTPAHHRRLHEQAPNSTFTLVNRADHMFHLEQFEVTSQLFETFLSGGDISQVKGHHLSTEASKLPPALQPAMT